MAYVPVGDVPGQDQEVVVRQHLGEQLDEIARFCKAAGKEAGYRLIIEVRIPPLFQLCHKRDVRADGR